MFKTKDEALIELQAMPNLPERFEFDLVNWCIQTGSTVYAPDIASGDVDFLFFGPPDVWKGYCVVSSDGYRVDGWSSIYVKNSVGAVWNVMCFSNEYLYDAWVMTTHMMFDLSCKHPGMFNEKWKRTRMFRAFRDIFTKPVQFEKEVNEIELVNQRRCVKCGLKANFFYDRKGRNIYREKGICVRCQTNEDRQCQI